MDSYKEIIIEKGIIKEIRDFEEDLKEKKEWK